MLEDILTLTTITTAFEYSKSIQLNSTDEQSSKKI